MGGGAQADASYADASLPLIKEVKDWAKNWDLVNAELRTAKATAPGHPLVNTTDQWTTTGIRRLLQQAAEADAAGIALTPGQLQNERFNLAKQVDGLMWLPPDVGHEALFVRRRGSENWQHHALGEGLEKKTLEDYVGKELAQRLREAPPSADERYGPHGWREIPDLGEVEIGGGGMRYAYDQMYPKKIAKELKRLDPDHPGYRQEYVRPHDLREPAGGLGYEHPFHYFELTPRAKEEIRKGLPLFQQGIPVADLLRAYYGEEKE